MRILAKSVCPLDQLAGSDQNRAHRRAQSLGKAHRYGVGATRELRGTMTGRHAGVPQTRTVEMHVQLQPIGDLANLRHALQRPDGASATIVRVFKYYHARPREVRAEWAVDSLDVTRQKATAIAADRANRTTRERRRAR